MFALLLVSIKNEESLYQPADGEECCFHKELGRYFRNVQSLHQKAEQQGVRNEYSGCKQIIPHSAFHHAVTVTKHKISVDGVIDSAADDARGYVADNQTVGQRAGEPQQ